MLILPFVPEERGRTWRLDGGVLRSRSLRTADRYTFPRAATSTGPRRCSRGSTRTRCSPRQRTLLGPGRFGGRVRRLPRRSPSRTRSSTSSPSTSASHRRAPSPELKRVLVVNGTRRHRRSATRSPRRSDRDRGRGDRAPNGGGGEHRPAARSSSSSPRRWSISRPPRRRSRPATSGTYQSELDAGAGARSQQAERLLAAEER